MNPKNWLKQPAEIRILEIDCTDAVPTGASISSAETKIFDSEGTEKTDMIGTSSKSGLKILIQVKGGTAGEDYSLRVRLNLSNTEIAEDDLKIFIRQILS
jgi:hypothetical protein